jgi:hypothetical protein
MMLVLIYMMAVHRCGDDLLLVSLVPYMREETGL